VTPRLDHPDLTATECRISLSMSTMRDREPPRWLSAHCRLPVVNDVWQICQKHDDERDRLIDLFGEVTR